VKTFMSKFMNPSATVYKNRMIGLPYWMKFNVSVAISTNTEELLSGIHPRYIIRHWRVLVKTFMSKFMNPSATVYKNRMIGLPYWMKFNV
jgi:SPX domain protein involved in polyphosphate accumulation